VAEENQTLEYATPAHLVTEPIEPAAAKSLGFGVLFFLTPVPAVLAIVYGIISLKRLRVRAARGRGAAWTGIALGSIGCFVWIWLGFTMAYGMRASTRIACMTHLRNIGVAIQMYAQTHAGQLPGGWDDLLAANLLQPQYLVCPGSTDTPARGATTQAVLLDYSAGGHATYIYLGHGLTIRDVKPASYTMIAYEVAGHGKYVNVLFADGHVESLPRDKFMKQVQTLWDQRALTSTRPSTRPSTRASTQPGGSVLLVPPAESSETTTHAG